LSFHPQRGDACANVHVCCGGRQGARSRWSRGKYSRVFRGVSWKQQQQLPVVGVRAEQRRSRTSVLVTFYNYVWRHSSRPAALLESSDNINPTSHRQGAPWTRVCGFFPKILLWNALLLSAISVVRQAIFLLPAGRLWSAVCILLHQNKPTLD